MSANAGLKGQNNPKTGFFKGAGCTHTTSVRYNQFLDNRKADAGSSGCTGTGTVEVKKAFKDER